ncbi:hypothetical protein PG990_002129 [Apiospora arundinis]|uniref:Uncharacterized protein n=1 Tax=Apiospora arundinis TaxID=335852 RepID=A0ABR2I3S5_9PEZI
MHLGGLSFPLSLPPTQTNDDPLRLTTCGRPLRSNGAPPRPCKPWFKATMASISTTRRKAAGEILAPTSSPSSTASSTTPWGLLCLLLVLFGVSFGCNDGRDAAFLFFPVAPLLESTTATDALAFVSRREPARFLGGSAANTVGYRPSHQHHTQPLRHHAAALVVRQPIESPGLVVGNDSANKVDSWQTRDDLLRPLDSDAPPSQSRGVSDLYRSVAETTKLTGMSTDDRTKSRRIKPLDSSPSTDL